MELVIWFAYVRGRLKLTRVSELIFYQGIDSLAARIYRCHFNRDFTQQHERVNLQQSPTGTVMQKEYEWSVVENEFSINEYLDKKFHQFIFIS